MKRITLPLTRESAASLRAGDAVLLSGVLYTGRDAAHKRLVALLQEGKELPFPLEGSTIYYTGPCPPMPGDVIGACGPTTSYRMDAYAPTLLDRGQLGMIGKGQRNDAVKQAVLRNGAVYFAATGGAGALLMQSVKSCRVIAFEDLGTEAVHELVVEDFPVIVALDAAGGDQYADGRKAYERP
ncbi:MAG: Fe-S-containing hydro-lyase [Clostridia bacterium]|nr:Fe-S-containing hydro-lyase [Clostridia bacterium]